MKTNLLVFLFLVYLCGLSPYLYSQSSPIPQDCSTAEQLTFTNNITQSFTVAESDRTPSGVSPNCQGGTPADVWYKFTMPFDGSIRINIGTAKYTEVAIYQGDCLNIDSDPAAATVVCGSDGTYGYNLTSGQTYLVQAWAVISGQDVGFTLEASQPAANNDCSSSESLTFTGNSTNLVTMPETQRLPSTITPTCQNDFPPDAWYSFTMPYDGSIKIVTGSYPYTELAIYEGDCSMINSDPTAATVICGRNGDYGFGLVGGQTYYVQAWTVIRGQDIGFTLEASQPATNNNCAQAEQLNFTGNITDLVFAPETQRLASTVSPICQAGNPLDIWYKFTMPFDGIVRIETDSYSYTELAIYEGDCSAIIANPDAATIVCGRDNDYGYNLVGGQTYYVQAWAIVGHRDIGFSIEVTKQALNNDCSNAAPLVFGSNNISDHIVVPEDERISSGITPNCETNAPLDVWYSFVMPIDGYLRVDELGYNTTQLAIYIGDCNGSFSRIFCGGAGEFVYDLVQGQTYLIQAWNEYGGGEVDFQLSVHTPATNDECVDAETLIFDSNNSASALVPYPGGTESANPASCQYSGYHDLWYEMTSPITGVYSIDGRNALGAGFAVYKKDGSSCFGAEIACLDFSYNTFRVSKDETYIIRAFRTNGTDAFTMSLTPSSIPVSLISNGQCVGAPSIPVVVIDASNNNEWVNILDTDGNIVAAIHANGNNLGSVTTNLFISTNDFLTVTSSQPDPNYYMKRTISIEPDVQPSSPVKVRLYYLLSEFNALKAADLSIGNSGDLVSYQVSGQDCSTQYTGEEGESIALQTSYHSSGEFVSEMQVSSFSKFLIVSDAFSAGLPVELISFTASKVDETSLLRWSTASETNNRGFSIEHSTDGDAWDEIGWIDGAGSSDEKRDYSFVHDYPYAGSNYYRLKQVDYDGTTTFSEIKRVIVQSNEWSISLYPNPAVNHLSIQSNIPVTRVTIRNSLGQIVKASQKNPYLKQINVNDLAPGFYSIEFLSSGDRKIKPFVKR